MQGRKRIAPLITEGGWKFYGEIFPNTNAGVVFTLESFPELYKRALRELTGRFTRAELLLVVDVYNATALTPGMPMVEAQVVDGMALDGLDAKWEVDRPELTAKVKGLTSFQAAALEIWANGYWYARSGEELRDLEKYVGNLK
jgi:hypothetical protein